MLQMLVTIILMNVVIITTIKAGKAITDVIEWARYERRRRLREADTFNRDDEILATAGLTDPEDAAAWAAKLRANSEYGKMDVVSRYPEPRPPLVHLNNGDTP